MTPAPRKVDANQAEIVAGLRAVGASVTLLHMVGRGCPDLLVGFRSRNYLLECKVPGGRLTKAEYEWHESWPGQKAIIKTLEEALAVIGAI